MVIQACLRLHPIRLFCCLHLRGGLNSCGCSLRCAELFEAKATRPCEIPSTSYHVFLSFSNVPVCLSAGSLVENVSNDHRPGAVVPPQPRGKDDWLRPSFPVSVREAVAQFVAWHWHRALELKRARNSARSSVWPVLPRCPMRAEYVTHNSCETSCPSPLLAAVRWLFHPLLRSLLIASAFCPARLLSLRPHARRSVPPPPPLDPPRYFSI